MMMNSPSSQTILLPTGGLKRSRCSSIQRWKFSGVRRIMGPSGGLADRGDDLQFHVDGRRQAAHLDRRAARLDAGEVLPVHPVEPLEVALDGGEEDRDVD